MSPLSQRLTVFRRLPLRAQLATITATKTNQVLRQNSDYIAALERVHAESLADASETEKSAYYKSYKLLES